MLILQQEELGKSSDAYVWALYTKKKKKKKALWPQIKYLFL